MKMDKKLEKFLSNYELIGDVQSFERDKNTILFKTLNKIIKIFLLTDKIFRIRIYNLDESLSDYSWAVIEQEFNEIDFEVQENPESVEIATKEMRLIIKKSPFHLTVKDKEEVIWEDAASAGFGWKDEEIIYVKKLPANEHFFGFGEKTGSLDKRGYHYLMKTREAVGYQGKTDPLYQSHPFFIGIKSGKSYGVFFDNTWTTFFDMGKKFDDHYYFGAENGELNVYFLYGPSMKDVIENYTQLIGRILLPPIWSLGYFQCRWGYKNQEKIKNIASELRTRNIPADSIVLDIDYMDGYRVFTWNEKRFPDEDFFKEIKEKMNFHFASIVDPGVKIDDEYFMYQEGIENDYFVKKKNGEYWKGYVWPGATYFPDFTKKEVRKWWGDKLDILLNRGISGIWNDMNEPSYNIEPYFHPFLKTKNLVFYDHGLKTPFNKNRNIYGLLMSRATHEGLLRHKPNTRPWILTRSGFSGIHRYAAVWTGDNTSNWQHLALSIPMLLNMGLSSIPFCGADIGGFTIWFNALRKLFFKLGKNMITRWHQLGVFYPFCRNHTMKHSKPQEPWQFGEEIENIIKKYLRLRYRWIPYLYNLFVKCSQNGLPPMRALILEFPDDETCYEMDYEFMWGEYILVAPIIKKKKKVKDVYLPKGVWVNRWSGEKIEGPKSIEVEIDLKDIPIYIRTGAIIPCQPDMQYFKEKENNPLIIEIYPDKSVETSYTYQEDDGESLEYLKGKLCTTDYHLKQIKDLIEFSISKRIGDYKPKDRDYLLLFKSIQIPRKVLLNDEELTETDNLVKNKWSYNIEEKEVSIQFDDAGKKYMIQLYL
ncbi:MAG: DUF4968 domain-containing protein [Candidatus Lokiarchaeota archaeon]|nr:DUF4968 domain-containing protein [Candidatus Lokiarchaeota archaeon]